MRGVRQSVLQPPEPVPVHPEECRLEIAAVQEATTHISGIGWRLSAPDGSETIRTETRRYGRTLLFSELAALRRGLEEAERHHCRRVVVRVPSPAIERLLRGELGSRYRRAQSTAQALGPQIARFEELRFASGHPPDPELTHAVGEALDAGLHAAAEREEHRVEVMERIIERAKSVHLESRDGVWVANDRYRVQLDPMHCECPAWTARWARTSIAARRAQRLPCKHLVALALRQGLSVPADLAQLARRAPP